MKAETDRSIPFVRQDAYLRAASVPTESARKPVEREAANQERRVAMTRAGLIGLGAIVSAECLFKIVELAFRLLQ
jgi:hypothetical protein